MSNENGDSATTQPAATAGNDNPMMTVNQEAAEKDDDVDDAHTNDKSNVRNGHGDCTKSAASAVALVELSLENVTYYRPSSSRASSGHQTTSTRILSNVTTKIAPYSLSAWMGPSGAGKSTLLSIAAGSANPQLMGPDSIIRMNNSATGSFPKRLVGVVWQEDLLLSNLTVYENIYYVARLKTPHSTPHTTANTTTTSSSTQKDVVSTLVHQVIQDLGLQQVQDSVVGSAIGMGNRRGISGGERKRTSVATELISRPSLLLLDEPTSGLDATTSIQLMKTLQNLANRGHAIAVVIHQPRTEIFNMFQHLLLLSQGKIVYDGAPRHVRGYLEAQLGDELPPETGIADWIMDVIKEDESSSSREGSISSSSEPVLTRSWDALQQQQQGDGTARFQEQNDNNTKLCSIQDLELSVPTYHASFGTQFRLLTRRTLKQQRGERLTRMALYLQLCYLAFTAIFWWRLPDTDFWIFERNSLLFFMVIAQANGIVISAVTVFQRQERALLQRERHKKLYGVLSYFLAKTVGDMTANVLLPVSYGLLVYWTAGFRPTAVAYFKFALAYYLTLSTAQSMGLWLSIILPSLPLALALAPPLTLFFMIMGGFYIRFENMPVWIVWSSWLSFARYGYSALIINEYQGRDIPCENDDGGMSNCPMAGNDVISGLGIHGIAGNFWFNIGMISLLQVCFRCAAYVALRRKR